MRVRVREAPRVRIRQHNSGIQDPRGKVMRIFLLLSVVCWCKVWMGKINGHFFS